MKYKKYILLLIFAITCFGHSVYAESISSNKLNYEITDSKVVKLEAKYNIDSYNKSNNPIDCKNLIDSSTRQLIKDILKYPRYIVPAIVILLGTLDLFKAVIAGKEDEMKKAQKTFIKRVIIGVLVFLIPVLIDIIIWLTNIAWEGLGYTACPL